MMKNYVKAIICAILFATASAFAGEARLKFGVLSDIHLTAPGDENYFVGALEYFRDNGADAVICAGDLTDHATVVQLQRVADCWFKVFPDGRAPDGRKVEQLFIYGNHDSDAWRWGGAEKTKKIQDTPELQEPLISVTPEKRKETWEKFFREPYAPVWEKTVKGYTFVGAHCGHGSLADYLATNITRIAASGKPFFCVQHEHLKGTTFGDWGWGHDNGRAYEVLTNYPNAVAFSGHSHYSLTDERSIWQGEFLSLNAGSLRYSSNEYSMRENGNRSGGYRKWLDWRSRFKSSGFDRNLGQQGMLVTVTDNEIRFERREFHFGESLGPDWVVPLGKGADKPYAYETRRTSRKAPEFATNAVVTVTEKNAKERKDENGKVLRPETEIEVSFPSAQTVDECRVFEYEITAFIIEDDTDIQLETHRILANDMILAPSRAGKEPNHIIFQGHRLPPNAHIRFDVYPIECFGKKGKCISSDGQYVTK